MKRLAFLVVVLALVAALMLPGAKGTEVAASPGDLTISVPTLFTDLDGSASDDDATVNGVLTVNGTLTIATGGSITRNDPASPTGNSAGPISIDVTGNMSMQAGSFIEARNTVGAGNGGTIAIIVGGDLLMAGADGGNPGARIDNSAGGASNNNAGANITVAVGGNMEMGPGSIIKGESAKNGSGTNINIAVGGDLTLTGGTPGALISSSVPGGTGGNAGSITINVGNCTATPPTGDIVVEYGAVIKANSAKGAAGAIVMNACRHIDMDGLIESASVRSGTGAVQGPGGGPITLDANCDLTISDTGVVRSKGQDPGADLIHLEGGCDVLIYGLVESTGVGHATPNSPPNHLNSSYRPDKPANSTTGVEVWAGNYLLIDSVNANGEVDADGGPGGRGWIDLFCRGDIEIIGDTVAPFAVHANRAGGTNQVGGIVTVKSTEGKVTASGLAVSADGNVAGGTGGAITIEAALNVTLDTASIYARGDFNQSGGYGTGGKLGTLGGDGIGGGNDVPGIRSFNSTISWINGVGDVRPTGTDNVGTVLPAAKRGEIILQDCTAGPIDMTGTSFPNNGLPATTPTELADTCGGAPMLQSYVVLPPCLCEECHATLEIIKVVVGEVPDSDWEFTSNITGYESFNITAAGGSVLIDPIAPGTYNVTEIPKAGYGITPSNPQQIVIGECDDAELTFTNTFEGCKWCTKGAVLSQVWQNMGVCCAVPDVLVDLRGFDDSGDDGDCTTVDPTKAGTDEPATCSIQAAVDYVNANGDVNSDGYLFIGVTAQDCGTGIVGPSDTPEMQSCVGQIGRAPGGGSGPEGYENVVITNTHSERLNVFGCSVDLAAANSSLPVITIEDSVGKVTVLDIHVWGSEVAGYLIENNADLVVVKNSRSFGASGIGYWVNDDDVEITGSPEISGHDIGILVEGNNVKLRTNNDINDNGIGIKITGDSNESNGNDVGEEGKPNGIGILVEGKDNYLHGDNVIYNTGDGIVIAGNGTSLANGNFATDEDSQHNGGAGIVVSGNFNTLDRNHQIKFNTGDGIEVSGNNNKLNENTLEDNGGHGIYVSGNANTLIKNEASDNGGNGIFVTGDTNVLNENTAEENTLNGIKADSADGASGNNLYKNEGNDNDLQGIRACGQNDLGDNDGEDNGVWPDVVFVCSSGSAKFFVSDESDSRVYKYTDSWVILNRFDLNSNNDDPSGVAVVGTDVYVLDANDDKVYKYDASGTLLATSRTLKQFNPSGNNLNTPTGLAIDGDELWIADDGNTELLRYSLTSAFSAGGNLNALQEIDLTGDNGSVEGLAIDANYLYVLDDGDKIVYRYARSDGTQTVSKVLKEVGGGGLSAPSGATLDGTSLWVMDSGKDKAYQYSLALLFSGGGNLNASSEYALHSDNESPSGV